MAETQDHIETNEADSTEEMLCPHCLEPVDPISHFCNNCAGPISGHSAVDPLGQVYALGHAYRTATARPTRLITVLGIWLIFAPQVIILVPVTYSLLSYVVVSHNPADIQDDFPEYAAIAIATVITAVVTAIYTLAIYKTTRGYIQTRRFARGLCPNCKYDLRGSTGNPRCPECGQAIPWLEDDEQEPLQA